MATGTRPTVSLVAWAGPAVRLGGSDVGSGHETRRHSSPTAQIAVGTAEFATGAQVSRAADESPASATSGSAEAEAGVVTGDAAAGGPDVAQGGATCVLSAVCATWHGSLWAVPSGASHAVTTTFVTSDAAAVRAATERLQALVAAASREAGIGPVAGPSDAASTPVALALAIAFTGGPPHAVAATAQPELAEFLRYGRVTCCSRWHRARGGPHRGHWAPPLAWWAAGSWIALLRCWAPSIQARETSSRRLWQVRCDDRVPLALCTLFTAVCGCCVL